MAWLRRINGGVGVVANVALILSVLGLGSLGAFIATGLVWLTVALPWWSLLGIGVGVFLLIAAITLVIGIGVIGWWQKRHKPIVITPAPVPSAIDDLLRSGRDFSLTFKVGQDQATITTASAEVVGTATLTGDGDVVVQPEAARPIFEGVGNIVVHAPLVEGYGTVFPPTIKIDEHSPKKRR